MITLKLWSTFILGPISAIGPHSLLHIALKNNHGSVGIATWLRVEQLRNSGSIPCRSKGFSPIDNVADDTEIHQSPIPSPFQGAKRAGSNGQESPLYYSA
jgi:hypothetical protein